MTTTTLIPNPAINNRSRDVQTAEIADKTWVFRSRTWDRLKFEIEYARQRGTTANSYLICGVDTPVALMRGILGSLSFLNLTGRIQPNQRESLPKREFRYALPYLVPF